MAQLRQGGPYVWVTWLTKLLVGDASCEWAAWFKAQHESFSWDKGPGLHRLDSLTHRAYGNGCRRARAARRGRLLRLHREPEQHLL